METLTTLRTMFLFSPNLRYLAVARGLLSTLATHVADPCVPTQIRLAAEHMIIAALLHEKKCCMAESVEAIPSEFPVPFPTVSAVAVVSGDVSNAPFAVEVESMVALATELGVPTSNHMSMQL